MRQALIAATLGVAALVAASPVFAAKSAAAAPAAGPKIAFIDVEAVIANCQRGRQAAQVLEQKRKQLQDQADDKSTKLKALQDQLSKADPKSAGYADLQKQVQEQQSELQDFVNEGRQLLQERTQEARAPIEKELQSVLTQYVSDHHIDILLVRGSAVFVKDGFEISNDVVGAMDKDWAEIQRSMPAPAPTPAPAAGTH